MAIGKPDRFFFYHYACTLALQGKKEQAFDKLDLFLKTVTADMLQHKDYIISNEHLNPLKEDTRWKRFIEKLQQ
jgi:hypothetical protein